jgi:HEAT repeat protein
MRDLWLSQRRWPASSFLILVCVFSLVGCGGGLSGSSPDELATSASKLGVRGADENVDVLVEAIRQEPELVQHAAVASLGRIGTPKAVEALALFADHESRVMRVAVAQALADVETDAYPEAAEVLAEMGPNALPRSPGDDPSLEVRRAVVTSLSITGQPIAAGFLLDRLENEYDESIRNAAVQTLGRLAEKYPLEELADPAEYIAALKEVYATDNEKNRAWAIESLGKLRDERALPVIMEAFDDYDAVTRGKAARALALIEGQDAIPELEKRLEQETADMPAVVIAHVLAVLGKTEDAVPLLEHYVLKASNNFARAEAARALREVGRRESMKALDRAFDQDRDGLVKREAGLSMRALREKFPLESDPDTQGAE